MKLRLEVRRDDKRYRGFSQVDQRELEEKLNQYAKEAIGYIAPIAILNRYCLQRAMIRAVFFGMSKILAE
jgi:hypothetical protein